MKMDNVGMHLPKDTNEAAQRRRKMGTKIRVNGNAFRQHLFAERAENLNGKDARIVPLFSLQAAHLRHQRFDAADLHAVYHVRDLHADPVGRPGSLPLRGCVFTGLIVTKSSTAIRR